MGGIGGQAFELLLPALTAICIRSKPSEGFESLREIIDHEEGVEVFFVDYLSQQACRDGKSPIIRHHALGLNS
jgi:hypothetical protein